MRSDAGGKVTQLLMVTPDDGRGSPGQWEECCLATRGLHVRWGLLCRGPSSYLISQQCFSKLQVVSFQDGGAMKLGQWVLGSEWQRKGDTHRENQHGMAEMKVKDVTQSCHLLILPAERISPE